MRNVMAMGLAGLLTATLLVAGAPTQSTHVDHEWGFKIRVPKDFRKIPPQVSERWIIGKYQSEKNFFTKDSWEFKPAMLLIIFPEERKKKKRVEVEEKKDEVTIRLQHKYKNYKDYLKGNFAGGGYYFSKEEEGKSGGIPVTRYEIKVEKLANTKQRIISWVYHLPDADLAVQFNVLEHRYTKMRGFAYQSLKSLRLAERKRSNTPKDDGGGASVTFSKKKERELTPAERMRRRRDRAAKTIAKAVASLPKGWKVKKSPHFTVLTHVDARFTKKVVDQAEAIRDWLDKNLGEISDEYVPRAIIRICVDSDEERAYQTGSRDFTITGAYEILVSKRTDFGRREELQWLSERISQHWFGYKNEDLRWYTPRWIRAGLINYMGSGMAKGRRLVFKPDPWEKDRIRHGEKNGHLLECRAVMMMNAKDYGNHVRKSEDVTDYQAASIIRYLLSPACKRKRNTKGVVESYLKNLNDVVLEIRKKEDAEDKKKGRGAAKTEEEEERRRKERAEKAKEREKYVIDEVFKRTFGDWTDKQWSAFQRGWAKATL